MKYNKEELYQISIQIVNKDCEVIKELSKADIKDFKVADIRSLSQESVRHFIKTSVNDLKINSDKVKINLKSRGNASKEKGVWIDSQGCKVCKTILYHGALLISGSSIDEKSITYRFVAPDFESYNKIISDLENSGINLKINEVGKYRPNGILLTKRQERVLWLAFKMGFFSCPRKSDTSEISRALNISPSTLSEITRRGICRLIENYFEDKQSIF